MEELKILFADLHKLHGALKDEVRDVGKMIEALLPGGDWNDVSNSVNDLITEITFAKNITQMMINEADKFLQDGPYAGEQAGITPLESLAKDN